MKIIWKYEKIWCVRGKAEYKLVHVVVYEYICRRKMTEGYGTKKRLLCCKRMIIFFLHPHISLVSTLFSWWFHGAGSHHADFGEISLEDEGAPQRSEDKIFRANFPSWVDIKKLQMGTSEERAYKAQCVWTLGCESEREDMYCTYWHRT